MYVQGTHYFIYPALSLSVTEEKIEEKKLEETEEMTSQQLSVPDCFQVFSPSTVNIHMDDVKETYAHTAYGNIIPITNYSIQHWNYSG